MDAPNHTLTAQDGECLPAWVVYLVVASFLIPFIRFIPTTPISILLIGLLSTACYYDLRTYRIPNWLTYSTAVIAITFNAIVSVVVKCNLSGWSLRPDSLGFLQSLLGLAVGFGVMSIVFVLAGRGAGDVKLAAAIGAIVGPVRVLSIIFSAHLLAAVFAMAWLLYRVGPLTLLRRGIRNLGSFVFPDRIERTAWELNQFLHQPIPLAGFFALGSILVIGGIIL